MTTIVVTFVCDFTKKIENAKKEKGKRKDKKSKRKLLQSDTEHKKCELVKDKDLVAVVENVEKPSKYIHIEYNLLPGKLNYKIDVVFWGTIAKIYTSDGIKAMKSINKNGHCWIAFSIKHKVLLDEDDLIKLKSHTANFLITTSKNKVLSSAAKKDAEQTFYFKEEDIKLKAEFAEAFANDPNVNKPEEETDINIRNLNDIKFIINDLMTFATKNEPQSDLNIIPDDLHQRKVLTIIEKTSNKEKIYCLNSLEDALNVNDLLVVKKGKGKEKGGKKSGKFKKNKSKMDGKQKKTDSSQISIPGESYFTNPNMSMFDLKLRNDDLFNSFVCINVHRLMNPDQKHELNPLIIKIDKIINIPTDILMEHGFSYIYVAYNICNINYKTGARPISKEMYFNDRHIYFMEKSSLKELAEHVQNGFIIFELNGIRILPTEKSGELFGQNINDEFISKPIQNKKTEILSFNEGDVEVKKKIVLLAVSCVRLHELVNPYWQFVRMEPCIHPRFIRNLDKNCDTFDAITTNTINIEYSNMFDQNPLTENILLTSGLGIKVGIQLIYPIVDVLNEMIQSGDSYNRILLTIFNLAKAKRLLFNLFVHNSHWLRRKNITPNLLCSKDDIPDEIYCKNVFTGFIIGCVDYCIMFLEGDRKLIKELFSSIKKERKKSMEIIYNSNNVHLERLYSSFIAYGGTYFISMQYSLNCLLSSNKTCIKGHMPEPCRRALQKLDLIKRSHFMTHIPDHLLPTVKELISLGIEWGVPLHWPL